MNVAAALFIASMVLGLAVLLGKNPLVPLIYFLRFISALCLSLASTLHAACMFFPNEFVSNFRATGESLQKIEVKA